MIRIFLCMSLLLILFPLSSLSEDWGSCSGELDSLRRVASDASDAAQDAESKREEFEDKKRELEDAKDELDNCRSYPDTYDYYSDNCESKRWAYNNAVDEYMYDSTPL